MLDAKTIIKTFEGCKLKAYKCPAGIWTIGYGHTANVYENTQIDQGTSEDLLEADLFFVNRQIQKLITVSLTNNQIEALKSFTFNVGSGRLKASTLRAKINRGEIEEAAQEFDKWVRAGGRVLKGLVTRRKIEKELFLQE